MNKAPCKSCVSHTCVQNPNKDSWGVSQERNNWGFPISIEEMSKELLERASVVVPCGWNLRWIRIDDDGTVLVDVDKGKTALTIPVSWSVIRTDKEIGEFMNVWTLLPSVESKELA